jgi:hypothetical protein
LVAAGLVGVLLGVGLSLAADAIAGTDLSTPVPAGIATVSGIPGHHRATEGPEESGSPSPEPSGEGQGSTGAGGGSETTQPTPTETHEASDGSDGGEGSDGGGSDGSDGGDD